MERPTTKRDHRGLKIGALLAVAALTAFAVLSGTLAKYTTTIDNTANARVARFAVSAGDGSGTIPLFDDVQDTDFGVEADVRTADYGDTPIIAPGTWGLYEIELINDSEVTVEYTMTVDIGDSPIPLQFSFDGVNWSDDLDGLELTGIMAINDNDVEEETIYWRWLFENEDDVEAGDEYDTGLGTADPLDEVTVTVHVNFTQRD